MVQIQKAEASVTEDAMNILKEWTWPNMGRKPMWATDGKPPAPTLLASRCLATLSTIKREENRWKLSQLVKELDEMERGDNKRQYDIKVNSLIGANTALDSLDESEAVQDFLQMRALLHLVLRVDE